MLQEKSFPHVVPDQTKPSRRNNVKAGFLSPLIYAISVKSNFFLYVDLFLDSVKFQLSVCSHSSILSFFFRNLVGLGYLSLYKFQNQLVEISMKYTFIGILVRIKLNLQNNLEKTDIFIILTQSVDAIYLPIYLGIYIFQ